MGTDLLQLAKIGNQLKLSTFQLGQLLFLNLPQILYYVLPMATLMAVLLTLSRLSANSEIVAMEAGGVSRKQIVKPVLWMGLALSILGFVLGELIVPKANSARIQLLAQEKTGPQVLQNVILRDYKDGQLTRLLYAKVYDNIRQVMEDAVVQEFEAGELRRTIKTGQIFWDRGSWYYSKAEAYEYLEDGRVVSASFHSVRQPLPLSVEPRQIAQQQKRPEEMNWWELKAQIAFLRKQGEDVKKLEVLWQQKMVIPLACLVFVMVGAPLGIQSHRTASSKGFGQSVVIIFVYYLILSLGSSLGEGGQLPASISVWLVNFVLGGWGIYLLWKSGR